MKIISKRIVKKNLICLFLIFCSVSIFAEKKKLSIKNTFGGDSDELGDFDLYSHLKEKIASDETVETDIFAVGDRFQLDFESSLVTSRFTLEIAYNKSSGAQEIPSLVFVPNGFIQLTPGKHFSVIAGNNYSKQFAISSGYLAAADDTTKYARILTDSLGYKEYAGNNDVALFCNGFGAGSALNFNFGKNNQSYLLLAGGAMFYGDKEIFDYSLDFGFNAGKTDCFDFGFVAHNMISDSKKLGAFAGLKSIPNFTLNLGFYYNFTTSDYLPEYRVEKNGGYDFKKQKTKYALGVSTGYDFKKLGLGLYADFISGLTNQYIGNIKYYDDNDNLIKTVTKTIIRGQTSIKYEDGVAKRTDDCNHNAIPFYAQFRLSYDITKSLNFDCRFKLCSMWNDYSQTWLSLYPKLSYDLPSSLGKISAGVRLDMNKARFDGLSGISIPISYTYKYKTKF
ncbi:MAG: hypothetical protein J6X84_06110 [Treponema sp.]|nr:hypothetical protein [Treponema sp.]